MKASHWASTSIQPRCTLLMPVCWAMMLGMALTFSACNREQANNGQSDSSEKSLAKITQKGKTILSGKTQSPIAQAGYESTDSIKEDTSRHTDESVRSFLENKLKPAEAIDLTNRLDTLTKQAQEFELQGHFGAAVQAWQKVRQALMTQFAADSWQVANADVSLDFATRISAFSPAQYQQFERLKQLKSELDQAVSQKENQRAVATCGECERIVVELFGADSVWNARTQLQFGELYFLQQNWISAIERLQYAFKLFDQRYPSPHPDMEKSLELIAKSLKVTNRLNEAMPVQQSLIEMTKVIWGANTVEHAKRLNDLGTLQHSMKQLDQAELTLANADSIREKLLGPEHLERAITLRNRAVVALDKKQLDTARSMFSHASDIFLKEVGATHQWSIDASKKLAVVYLMQKENEKAESELTKVKQAVFQSLGDQNVDYAEACFELAIALGNQGKFEKAKPLLESAMKIQKTFLGPQDPKTQRTATVLTTVNQRLENRKLNR